MIGKDNPYNTEIAGIEALQKISGREITEQLQDYPESYRGCFVRTQQIKYFEAFEKGLLSNLERKSIEPIALSFLEKKKCEGCRSFSHAQQAGTNQ